MSELLDSAPPSPLVTMSLLDFGPPSSPITMSVPSNVEGGVGEAVLDEAGKALWLIAFRRQHLQHRSALLIKAREFSLRSQPGNDGDNNDDAPPDDSINVVELEIIQAELKELSRREETLRRSGGLQKDPQDVRLFGEQIFPEPDYEIEYAPPDYDISSIQDEPSEHGVEPEESSVSGITASEDAEEQDDPNAPPDEDLMSPDKLRRQADWVKCETCSRSVLTVTRHSVTDTTWLMCGIFSAVGCVFGCCLIPFMVNYFKDISHYCPKCNSKICNVPRF